MMKNEIAHAVRVVLSIFSACLLLACSGGDDNTIDPFASQAPVAAFDQDVTSGTAGLVVQFSSTSRGEISTYEWDFGGGEGETTATNPLVTFPSVGSYDIALKVRGPLGEAFVTRSGLITVGDPVSAGFSCTGYATCVDVVGFAPFDLTWTDTSSGADTYQWDFGDGTTSNEASPTHTYNEPGTYQVVQTVSGPGGTSQAEVGVAVGTFSITTEVESGDDLPQTVRFAVDTGELPTGLPMWSVSKTDAGGTVEIWNYNNPSVGPCALGAEQIVEGDDEAPILFIRCTLRESGDYTVSVASTNINPSFFESSAVDFTVACAEATPDWAIRTADETTADTESGPTVGGTGPLTVDFEDRSTGQIDRWDWTFGDSERCVFPNQNPGGIDPDYQGAPVCLDAQGEESASPAHTYSSIGSYDVSLQLTGAAASCLGSAVVSSPAAVSDTVRVYLEDASFENQIAGTAVGAPWVHLPAYSLELGESPIHTIASQSDQGMPTDGLLYAVLDGIGTDGSGAVPAMPGNQIAQDFILPRTRTVLEFDVSFLFAEPPASGILDRVVAEVSDGTGASPQAIAFIDTTAAYAGISDLPGAGEAFRVTPPRTFSIDVASAFGVSTPTEPPSGDEKYTLTIGVGNAQDAVNPPRAYVDHVRFVEPTAELLTADFTWPAGVVVAGTPVSFTDASCLGPVTADCTAPTSWLWDFGTSNLANPPAQSASNQQNPTYTFDEPGTYPVTLTVGYADQSDPATQNVTVVAGATAEWSVSPAGPYSAGAILTFSDASTADLQDPIVQWAWDFDRWDNAMTGTTTFETATPDPVTFPQVGSWTVTLTITTQSGLISTFAQDVTIE